MIVLIDRHIVNTDGSVNNRQTIFELFLPAASNGTVTVFQTIRREFCPPFRSQNETLKKALLSFHEELKELPSFICFGSIKPMRAHLYLNTP